MNQNHDEKRDNHIPFNRIYLLSEGYIHQVFINHNKITNKIKNLCVKYLLFNDESTAHDYNIKQEIADIIGHHKWDQTQNKANIFHECYITHKYETLSAGTLFDPFFGIDISWQKGERISSAEVFLLRLYVDFDSLQKAFKKCSSRPLFRFFYFRRALLIIIHKYGSNFACNDKKDNMELFIPVNNQMARTLTKTLVCYGPLSATSSLEVARILASCMEYGNVLTIKPRLSDKKNCQILNASFISDSPEEEEWIIGCMYSNMKQTESHYQFVKYNDGCV